MCLILTAYQKHPKYKLIVLANRDEFYKRPSAQADWWLEHPNLLAGKDLVGGGTWLGLNRTGNFAALTNYRDPSIFKKVAPTRGALLTNYLLSNTNAEDYLASLKPEAHLYNGYNLFLSSGENFYYYSNLENKIEQLNPGIYGLCNHLLDTPWPKVKRARSNFQKLIEETNFNVDEAFNLMLDSQQAEDGELPSTGISIDWERAVSPIFIEADGYGTRCSSLLLIDHKENVYFEERSYAPKANKKQFEFKIEV